MTPAWKFVLNQTSVEALLASRQRDRQRLLAYFGKLVDNPSEEGDFQADDEIGRPVQIKAVGKHMITFWADHAVREMRVINIEKI